MDAGVDGGLAETYALAALPPEIQARVFLLGNGHLPSEGLLLGLAWELWREHPRSSEDDLMELPWLAPWLSTPGCMSRFQTTLCMRKGPGLWAHGVTMRAACLELIGKVLAFEPDAKRGGA